MDPSSPLRANDPALAEALARNVGEAVGHFHHRTPGAVLDRAADLVFADSGVADPTFNAVAFARIPPECADARVEQVVARMMSTGRPFTWWVDPGSAPCDLGERLLAAGFKEAESMPAMVLALDAPVGSVAPAAPGGPASTAGSGLKIREVHTESQWADFAEVMACSWDPPSAEIRTFLGRARPSALAPGAPGRFLVGYLDDGPVCTAEVLLHAGVAVLYNVITAAAQQRRGYGTAMTVAALDIARAAGYRVAALQASAQGEPVYRRLGFEQVGRYTIYAIGG